MPHRTDDNSLDDNEGLLRRIVDIPEWVKITERGLRPSSAAFLDGYTNEVSVSVESLTTLDQIANQYPNVGIVRIIAGDPRQLGCIVSQTPEVPDPSHRVICPPPDLSRKNRKQVARVLAEKAKWLILPNSHRDS